VAVLARCNLYVKILIKNFMLSNLSIWFASMRSKKIVHLMKSDYWLPSISHTLLHSKDHSSTMKVKVCVLSCNMLMEEILKVKLMKDSRKTMGKDSNRHLYGRLLSSYSRDWKFYIVIKSSTETSKAPMYSSLKESQN